MNLNEIKKMVITSLIQERVGYYGAMDGDAGGQLITRYSRYC